MHRQPARATSSATSNGSPGAERTDARARRRRARGGSRRTCAHPPATPQVALDERARPQLADLLDVNELVEQSRERTGSPAPRGTTIVSRYVMPRIRSTSTAEIPRRRARPRNRESVIRGTTATRAIASVSGRKNGSMARSASDEIGAAEVAMAGPAALDPAHAPVRQQAHQSPGPRGFHLGGFEGRSPAGRPPVAPPPAAGATCPRTPRPARAAPHVGRARRPGPRRGRRSPRRPRPSTGGGR